MKHFYIIANLDKEYVKEAQAFIKTYLEAKGAACRLNNPCLLYTSDAADD